MEFGETACIKDKRPLCRLESAGSERAELRPGWKRRIGDRVKDFGPPGGPKSRFRFSLLAARRIAARRIAAPGRLGRLGVNGGGEDHCEGDGCKHTLHENSP